MKKMMSVLALLFAFVSASAAFAADNLAYKDGLSVGFMVERNEHTLDDFGNVRTTGYGPRLSYDHKQLGLHASAALTIENGKADLADYYGDVITLNGDNIPALSVEVSKRLHQFDDGFQVGVYGKLKYYFGTFTAGWSDVYEGNMYYSGGNPDGQRYVENYGINSETSNLRMIEVGLLAQKDWKTVHLYVGPALQLVRANYTETAWSDVWGNDSFGTHVREKSTAAGIAGAKIDLGSGFTLGLSATFKERASYAAVLEKALF